MKHKIFKWFRQGLWNEEMVYMAVQKGILTVQEGNSVIHNEVLL